MANFTFTKNDALVIGSVCFGVACLVYAFRCNDELGLISSKVDISLKKLNEMTHVEVSDEIVNRFVEKSAKEAVKTAVEKQASKVAESLRLDMASDVKSKVIQSIYA